MPLPQPTHPTALRPTMSGTARVAASFSPTPDSHPFSLSSCAIALDDDEFWALFALGRFPQLLASLHLPQRLLPLLRPKTPKQRTFQHFLCPSCVFSVTSDFNSLRHVRFSQSTAHSTHRDTFRGGGFRSEFDATFSALFPARFAAPCLPAAIFRGGV